MASFDDYDYLERQLDAPADGAPAPAGDEPAADKEKDRGGDKEEKRRSRSRSRSRKSKGRSRSRSRSRERRKGRRSRSRSRDRGDRDRRREKDRTDRDGGRDGGRDRDRERFARRDDDRRRDFRDYRRAGTPEDVRLAREKERELKELERATRTVFAFNLSLKAEEKDIFKFFSQAGKVLDIKLITDKTTRRSKGMAYIEFEAQEHVFMAMQSLPGQPLLGQPVQVKGSEVEKNLAWEAAQQAKQVATSMANESAASSLLSSMGGHPTGGLTVPSGMGPCRLQVNNLHPDVDDVDLKAMFEVFGFLELINVEKDPAGKSLGYGFAQYREYGDGVKAMQHWNGKKLAEREILVSIVPLPTALPMVMPPVLPPELSGANPLAGLGLLSGAVPGLSLPGLGGMPGMGMTLPGPPGLPGAYVPGPAPPRGSPKELDDDDDNKGGGLRINAQTRAHLMQRLAANAGLEGPKPVMMMMQTAPVPAAPVPQVPSAVLMEQGLLGPASPIPTNCILLKNMFDPNDPANLEDPNWASEVEADVREECSRFGEVQHIYVDKNSKGNVYLKFANQQGAEAAHRALNLRWYSGKQILCEYQFAAVYGSFFGCR